MPDHTIVSGIWIATITDDVGEPRSYVVLPWESAWCSDAVIDAWLTQPWAHEDEVADELTLTLANGYAVFAMYWDVIDEETGREELFAELLRSDRDAYEPEWLTRVREAIQFTPVT